MNHLKLLFTVILFSVSYTSLSQTNELLSEIPATREEFIASEPKVIATIDWLENTPVGQDVEMRKKQYAYLVGWLTNSPTVTIEINSETLTFTDKNPDLLVIFMGGWTKYALQNNYSKDTIRGTVAGIKSAIKVYKTGLLKKDKEMQKLITLDDKGELENWVKSKLENN